LEYSLKVLSGREEALKILELIGGNRIHYGVNRLGGVRADLTLEVAKEIRDALYKIRAVSKYVYKSLDRNGEIGRLIRGKGVLKPEDAKRLGVVGPVLRSCGIASDIRRDSPYAAYPDLRFEVITEPDGDTQARAMVRIRETYESLKIIEQAVENIPCGELMGEIKEPLAGECFGRVEAPRGELVYFLVADGGNMPRGVKIRTPSYMNNSALPLMLIGEREKDIQLILESIDPCIACTDRLVRIKRSG
jgi:Ni,Fe-hydrogenase III large subunit